MKIRNICLGAILCAAVFSMTGCDHLNGDDTTIKGKTGVLTINLGGSTHKTRAWAEGPLQPNGGDGTKTVVENGIREFTLWVLENNNVVASYYYSGTEVQTTFTLTIPLTTNKAVVIANEGDLRTGNTYLGGVKTAIAINTYDDIKDLAAKIGAVDFGTVEQDDPIGTQYLGNLGQSGEQTIAWVSGSADVTVQLSYIAARITLSEVTLFGENVYTSSELSPAGQSKMAAAGISEISLSTIFIINGKDDTYLLDQGSGKGLVYTKDYYYGWDSGWNTGLYYPDLGAGYTNAHSPNFIANVGYYVSKPINSDYYQIFYAAENPDTGSTHGLTCVVILCSATLNDDVGTAAGFYYTIPLSAANTSLPGYSTKRGYNYNITADISSIGSSNPYNPQRDFGAFTWTITPSGWNEINPGGTILP